MVYEGKRTLACIVASLMYAIGVNLFVVPAQLYSGGLMGICQVIRTLLVEYLHMNFHSFDIAGIIYYIINSSSPLPGWAGSSSRRPWSPSRP